MTAPTLDRITTSDELVAWLEDNVPTPADPSPSWYDSPEARELRRRFLDVEARAVVDAVEDIERRRARLAVIHAFVVYAMNGQSARRAVTGIAAGGLS